VRLHEVGYVSGARGLAGELKVRITFPDDAALDVRRVRLASRDGDPPRELEVSRAQRPDPVTAVLHLVGVEDRAQAEALQGWTVEVAREWLRPGAAGCLLAYLDAEAFDAGTGDRIGRVRSIDHNGAHPILVLDTEAGERLVPLVDAFVGALDGDRLPIHPIPGLLDG
jgi:16S rRNA processing protein RimM